MSQLTTRPQNLADYRPGRNVTREEIQQVLADDGYSAGERQVWLKSLLSDLSQEDGEHETDAVDRELIDEIRQGVDRLQPAGEVQADSNS